MSCVKSKHNFTSLRRCQLRGDTVLDRRQSSIATSSLPLPRLEPWLEEKLVEDVYAQFMHIGVEDQMPVFADDA